MAAKNEELLIDHVQNAAKNLEGYSLSIDGYKVKVNDNQTHGILKPAEEVEGVSISSGDQMTTPREALEDFYHENGEELSSRAIETPNVTYLCLELSDCHFDKQLEDGEIDNYHAFLEYDPHNEEFNALCIVKEDGTYEEQEWWEDTVERQLQPEEDIENIEEVEEEEKTEIKEPSESFEEFVGS